MGKHHKPTNQIVNCFKNKTVIWKRTGTITSTTWNSPSLEGGWRRECSFAGLAHYTLCCKGSDEVIKRSIVPRLSVVISYTFTIYRKKQKPFLCRKKGRCLRTSGAEAHLLCGPKLQSGMPAFLSSWSPAGGQYRVFGPPCLLPVLAHTLTTVSCNSQTLLLLAGV